MLNQLPTWIEVLFIVTTLLTLSIFHFTLEKSSKLTLSLVLIGIIQCALAYWGFYLDFESMPPRFPLVLLPTIIVLAIDAKSRIKTLGSSTRDLSKTTLIHSIRIIVEIILFQLFVYKAISELMTFEGLNFDIIMGLTAPIAALLYHKNILKDRGLQLWNIIGIIFLIIIISISILCLPTPFQQLSLEQPNLAISYAPFILLPSIVVPVVLYTHILDIIYLKQRNILKH